jgi:hypothetical protein
MIIHQTLFSCLLTCIVNITRDGLCSLHNHMRRGIKMWCKNYWSEVASVGLWLQSALGTALRTQRIYMLRIHDEIVRGLETHTIDFSESVIFRSTHLIVLPDTPIIWGHISQSYFILPLCNALRNILFCMIQIFLSDVLLMSCVLE